MTKLIKNNTESAYVRAYSWIVIAGAFIAVATCLMLNIGEKNIVAVLPLAYCCCYFVFPGNRKYLKNFSLSIINISAFCRYIIYPVVIAITIDNGGYYPFKNEIIWILLYEMIGVFFVIGVFAKKLDVQRKKPFETDVSIGIPNFLLMASLLPAFIVFPTMLTRFSISVGVEKTTVGGIAEIFVVMGVWVLFVYTLSQLGNKKSNRNLKFIAVLLVAMYYVLFNAISGDDVKRWQIVSCGIAMVYLAINLFPEKKKLIIVWGALGISAAVIMGSILKFGLDASLAGFVRKLFNLDHFTEYFGGIKNMSIALDAFANNSKTQGLESLLTDLFSGFPILSALFDYDAYATPAIFQRYVNRRDIICPLTAQSIVHFGYFGAPVLAMIMTYLSIVFDRALKRTNNLFCAYVLVELVVFFSLFMGLNTTIILGKLWIRLMFLALQPINDRMKLRFKW